MVKTNKEDKKFIDFGFKQIQDLEARAKTPEIVIIGEKEGSPKLVFAGKTKDSNYELHEYIRRKKQDNGSLIYYAINCLAKNNLIQKFVPIENYIK